MQRDKCECESSVPQRISVFVSSDYQFAAEHQLKSVLVNAVMVSFSVTISISINKYIHEPDFKAGLANNQHKLKRLARVSTLIGLLVSDLGL